MRVVAIGGTHYQLAAAERGGRWVAHAVREDGGAPFGVECTGDSETAALDRLQQWLEWQYEHTAALEALQQAERGYHRTIAGSAFANPTEGPSAIELQKEALDAVEAARVRLDEVRARRPD